MDQKLKDKLIQRKEEGTLRSLSSFSGMIDFQSNDYLGLAKEKFLTNDVGAGSTGSRLIAGTSEEAISCEEILADHFDCEAALVFNSGYDANLGLFSSVPQKGDTILYDEEIHASVRDGIRLSFAKAYSFKHNDVEDLKLKLDRFGGTVYVAIESLYSITGQLAPINEIVQICQDRGVWLIVDEAHAVGVFGENGRGLTHEFRAAIFARLITFGKAYGAHGAAVLGSQELKDYLVNYARSFIYTTALPPTSYARISQVISNSSIRLKSEQLHHLICYFREKMKRFDLISDPRSPIQAIRVNDRQLLNDLVVACAKHTFALKAIFSPTVSQENECLRVILHAFNSVEQIDELHDILACSLALQITSTTTPTHCGKRLSVPCDPKILKNRDLS
jgi:8-amino-7-oxononanoate synthase